MTAVAMVVTYTSTYVATVTASLAPTFTETFVAPLAAPSGYVVNFNNPQRKADIDGYWVFAVGVFFTLGFLAMRMFVKVKITPPLNVEDFFLLLGWAFGIACQIMFVYMWIHKIHGLHAYEMSVERFNLYNILIVIGPSLFALCQFFAKFSILLFYHRLAPIPWFRVSVYLLMVLFAGYTLGIIAVMVFPCVPVAKSWDYTITGGRCVNRTMTLMAAALVNIVGELALLLVPMPILMKLQMPRMQKFGLFCMFAVGMLTCITSIVRLAVLAPILTDSDRDRPWSYSIPCVWIVAEANLITVCGCLPVTKKFLRHVAPRLIGESSSSSSSFAIGTGAAYANGGSTPLRTIGSMRSRPKRARLGVECHPLEMDEGESEEGEEQSPENERIRAWSDGGSETAIVVTKRTTVESVRESGERRSGGCGQPMGLPETMRSGGFA